MREEEPETVAIVVTGSYATGRATARSDLDLNVLTEAPPRLGRYRTWFEPRRDGPPLHVSAGVQTLRRWIERAGEPVEPDDWSLGFPTEEAARFLWANDRARAALGDPPTVRRPGADPEVEDLFEAATKVARPSRPTGSARAGTPPTSDAASPTCCARSTPSAGCATAATRSRPR